MKRKVLSESRVHVLVSGRVQGVFFRVFVREKARELGLAGWVRNTEDGKVEAVFEGEKEKILKMVAWCKQGPPGAKVEKVETEWTGDQAESGWEKEELEGFEVRD
jgi:acylphosphatase